RGYDHIAAAQNCRVAGETAAGGHAHEWDRAGEPPPKFEPANEAAAFRVAWPAAAALREEHSRQPPAQSDCAHAIDVFVVVRGLRAGEHRVVIRHDGAAGLVFGKLSAVDMPQSHDHTVCRRLRDQFVERIASTTGGDHKPSVLRERAGIAKIVYVLAGRSL